MRKVHYVANSQFRHIFFFMPWSTSTRIEAQPELSARQQQHSHHVVLQAFAYKTAKKRENLQINRTATVQQYRCSSIEQFSSISTVYSGTIHPRANSPKLNPFSTIGVKSNPMSAIGISASETKASYRLVCLALKRISCDHDGYETSVPSVSYTHLTLPTKA